MLQLLIVPIVLGYGTWFLQETAKQKDLQIAQDNRNKDLEIADKRAKQETLNRYFDDISNLLFERKLRTMKREDEARIVARAKTLTALSQLDGERKFKLINFLYEAKLIDRENPIIDLRGADLRNLDLNSANLKGVNLSGANLEGAHLAYADFSESNLSDVILTNSVLESVNFKKSRLQQMKLNGSEVIATNFSQSDLSSANFSKATIAGAIFTKATLNYVSFETTVFDELLALSTADSPIPRGRERTYTNFEEADLPQANFRGAKFRYQQSPFNSGYFCMTTMPDGKENNRNCDKYKITRNKPISNDFSGLFKQ